MTTTKATKCPFEVDYYIECNNPDCSRDCPIRSERERKENEGIADSMRSYWMHKADGAER